MDTKLSPEILFNKYIRALKRQSDKDERIKHLEHNLGLRNWNLYFFARAGINQYKYDVWCNRLSQFKNEFNKHLEPHEYLWDLCWFQREKRVNRGESDFCALALEQEFNDAITSEAAWMDFTKILFAEVTQLRVFIGKSSQRGFKGIPDEWAGYYRMHSCHKEARLLLILINQAKSNDLTIRGWELTKHGKAKELGEPTFFSYSGYV